MTWIEPSEVVCSGLEDEEDYFFDSREQLSDLNSESDDDYPAISVDATSSMIGYKTWIENFVSVKDRKARFLRWMESKDNSSEETFDFLSGFNSGNPRDVESNGTGLGYDFYDTFVSSRSVETPKLSPYLEDSESYVENLYQNIESGMYHNVEVVSNQFRKLQRSNRLSPRVHESFHLGRETSNTLPLTKKLKITLLKKLGVTECFTSGGVEGSIVSNDLHVEAKFEFKRVPVHIRKKKSKELSSLHEGQVIRAHEGSILTMKFSLDGQYLATGGEDGIVRVWKVVEEERWNKFDMSDVDPSCLYFSVDGQSKLSLLDLNKLDKKNQPNNSYSACVIFPEKLFHLLEEPLHVFNGHRGDVLDLSWSPNGFLLSASVDKTVRLWRVGCNHCLRVLSHNNYVTCVEFNPADDNYLISGSIDGKVRIWELRSWRVVDWIDIKEMVTAVCYHPGGKTGIIGSMTGYCYLYELKDNVLHLGETICLQGKRKMPVKRISGFQFCPGDPRKVMITCAGSRVRIIDGSRVMCKFNGLRSNGAHISASFTADGRHVVSADDSNITVWNHNYAHRNPSKLKSQRSYETFSAPNASIALSWYGRKASPSPSPSSFALATGFLSPKGAATWPEEKLSSPNSTLGKSEYRLIKTACNDTQHSAHLWGLVTVTAGRDGRIRTFHNYGLPTHP